LWIKRNHVENEITSIRYTKELSHKIKSITHHLPTSDLQSRYYLLLYNSVSTIQCPTCELEKDDNTHIGRCIITKNNINTTFAEGKETLKRLLMDSEDINSLLIDSGLDRLQCLSPLILEEEHIPESHHIYLWAHNIIPNELILFLQSYIKKSLTLKNIL
jgi:hypothetical protein